MKIFLAIIIFIGFDLVVALRSETDEEKLSHYSNRRSTHPVVKDNPGSRGFSVTKSKSTRKSNSELSSSSKAVASPDVSVDQSDSGINYTSENETLARNQDPRVIKPRESSPTTKKNVVFQILETRSMKHGKVGEGRKKHVPRKIVEIGGRNLARWKNWPKKQSKSSSKYRARIFGRNKKSNRFSELKIVPGKGWTANYRYSGRGSSGEGESKKNVNRSLHYSVNRRGAFSGHKRDGKTIEKIVRRIFGKKSDSSRRQFSKPERLRLCGNDK